MALKYGIVVLIAASILIGHGRAYISISHILPNDTVMYSNCMLHDLKDMRNQTFDPTGLIINHCYIPDLPNAFFIRLKNLTLLEIVESKLLTIGDFALNGLPYLKSLSLIKNNISEIKSWCMDDMKNLTSLDIRRNQIKSIRAKDFQRFPNLQKLNMAVNFISDLPPNVFSYVPNLKHLNLGRNVLVTVNAYVFRGLAKLTHLALHHNHIQAIDKDAFLTNANLRSLRLEGNWMARIQPVLIQSMPRLGHLNVSHNLLEALEDGTFNKSIELKWLDLSYNRFENITKDTFSGLHVLEMLNFTSNDIEKVHPLAFANLNHMVHFDISNNNLTSLPSGIFEYFRQVEYMNLSSNLLAEIHSNVFQQMEDLLILDLSENFLHSDIFLHRMLANLQYLDLSKNLFRAVNVTGVKAGRMNLNGNPWDCRWLVKEMGRTPDTVQFGSNYTVETKGQILDVLGIDCYEDMTMRSIILMKSSKCVETEMPTTTEPNVSRHHLLHLRMSTDTYDQKTVFLWLLAAVGVVFMAVHGGKKLLRKSELKSEEFRRMNQERIIHELGDYFDQPRANVNKPN